MFAYILIALAVLGSTNAFVATRGQMSMKMAGVSAPLGFFDPLGFSKTDAKTMAKYRDSELKHGRVAMLAVFGWLTQERFHPFYDGKLSGNPLKAAFEAPNLAYVQIFAFCGFLEWVFSSASKKDGYVPGDFYGISSRISDKDDESWVGFQTRELNNGRLAMFAILGEIVHAQISDKGAFEQLHSVGMI